MTDLVERLRASRAVWERTEGGSAGSRPTDLEIEAADEIASLRDTLRSVVSALRDAPRAGSEKDYPEGMRYIQISDTLAQRLVDQ